MFEQFVEGFRRGTSAAQLGRNRRDRRLEDLAEPAAGCCGVGDRSLARGLERRAVPGQVVEEAARLVLLCIEAGEGQQPSPVVAWLDDFRMQEPSHFVTARDELDFLDVVPE